MQKRNDRKNTENMDMPFLEKFMVSPDDYEIFKFGGTSLRDDERGLRTMLKYFPDFFTEEQIKPKFPVELYLGMAEDVRNLINIGLLTNFPLYKFIFTRYNYI